MSTMLRVLTLLLFVVLGAGLALCVASGFGPRDAVALFRGEAVAWPWNAEPEKTPADAAPADAPPAANTGLYTDHAPPDTSAGVAAASSRRLGEACTSPPGSENTPAASPAALQGPASQSRTDHAVAGVEPRHLPPTQTTTGKFSAAPLAAAKSADAHDSPASAPRNERLEHGDSPRGSRPPYPDRNPAARDAALCANPPEDQQARLISIIHELVKQPRVQTVSARMPEPATSGDEPQTVERIVAAPAATFKAAAKQATEPPAPTQSTPTTPTSATLPVRPPTATPKEGPPVKPDGPAAPPNIRITQSPKKSVNSLAPLGDGTNAFQIFVKDEDIRQVLALLGEAGKLNILPSPLVTGNVSMSLGNVSIDEALDAILKSKGLAARREGRFIYVGTPEEFVARDKRNDRIVARIYRPNYVSATEIKNLLTSLLTPGAGKISVSAPSKGGIESNDNQAGGNDLATREAVLVQDFETVLLQMDRVVLEIDRRPLQVAIEAMILSVKLDDQHVCGVDFQFLKNQGTVKLGLGSPTADLSGVSFADGGLKFAYLDANIANFIKALETIGDTNVISTPRLMTLNKQRAEILIGSELGYVSTTVTETSSTQSVNFLEVGTQLRIRPFISSDGMIRMEIHPELSTGSVRVESGLTLPDKEVTKVTTNIMVRDGSTVIIGGLMREDLTKNAKRIPWIGAMPAVGWLFGSKDEQTQRHEILVLVTPRIVCDDEANAEGNEAACDFHRRQNVFGDSMTPLGRSYLGRKYFRLAQEAWAAGDRERAMRYIDLSIHINPSDRAAIDLRSDVAAGVLYGEHTLQPGAPAIQAMPDGPPMMLREQVIDQAAPRLLPPGAAEIPGNQSLPPPSATPNSTPSATEEGTPAPEANPSPSDAAPPKARTSRRTALPVRPGRNP